MCAAIECVNRKTGCLASAPSKKGREKREREGKAKKERSSFLSLRIEKNF